MSDDWSLPFIFALISAHFALIVGFIFAFIFALVFAFIFGFIFACQLLWRGTTSHD